MRMQRRRGAISPSMALLCENSIPCLLKLPRSGGSRATASEAWHATSYLVLFTTCLGTKNIVYGRVHARSSNIVCRQRR